MEQAVDRKESSKLRVFICWSGARGRIVAEALRDWLPRVIQIVEPFMSEYIDKGSPWPDRLDEKLKAAQLGIICLTADNLREPWINFEAGALYMNLDRQRVCPYLLDLDYTELAWPLARFQATKVTKDETRKLLATVNEALGENRLKEAVLDETFEVWWPRLEKSIEATQQLKAQSKPAKRGSDEILEEVVNLVRSQSRQIESLEDVVGQLVAVSQYGVLTFSHGATTPADVEHLRAGRSPYAILRPMFVSADVASEIPLPPNVPRGTKTSRVTDPTPGTPPGIPGTRSESS
ncbi:MAG: TIR domain-containing protein [candidate division NC10 bacterium]|nr:TIR domain-containing protein [candidate division NC10 bacterium]